MTLFNAIAETAFDFGRLTMTHPMRQPSNKLDLIHTLTLSARSLNRMNLRECNEPMTEREQAQADDKRHGLQTIVGDTIRLLVRDGVPLSIEFQGDPRGCPIKVFIGDDIGQDNPTWSIDGGE